MSFLYADSIHNLWDDLANFDVAKADEALTFLFERLCDLVGAQNANWTGAVRLADVLPGDPVHGWRPRTIRSLHPSKKWDKSTQELAESLEKGTVDKTTVALVAAAGTFRTHRVADLVSPSWFDSDYYRAYYRAIGHEDAIWSGVPINGDAECYFGLFRDADHPRFTPKERNLVASILRGLKWFCRQQMLSHGLMVASAPLTATERNVLSGLLTGLTEREIATARHKSPHTIHQYVTSIFRKFGVNNRAALMALWLGEAA